MLACKSFASATTWSSFASLAGSVKVGKAVDSVSSLKKAGEFEEQKRNERSFFLPLPGSRSPSPSL